MAPQYTRQILRAVKSAEHLRTLELNSDDIYDETAEHWKRLINRDFPILSARHNLTPKDPRSWHKVYAAYKKLDDEEVAVATAKLSQSLATKQEEQDSRRSTIVSANQLPRPRKRNLLAEPPGKQNWFKKARKDLIRDATYRKHVAFGGADSRIKNPSKAVTTEARKRRQPEPAAPVIRAPRPMAAKNRLKRTIIDSDDLIDTTENQNDQILDDDDLFGDDLFGDHLIGEPKDKPATSTSPPAKSTSSLPATSALKRSSGTRRPQILYAAPASNSVVRRVLVPSSAGPAAAAAATAPARSPPAPEPDSPPRKRLRPS
ncbi:921c1f8b-dd82-4ecf-b4cd-58532910e72d [Thermothielavioides terrestris]|uniref:921c1f8b-dd82-4ecf-b4cd-58532910e72d n=1 Tax=Thermothielavioides terrestris TaxID=2587410 RepID=A0A3S4C0D6_9PEZI|nr:921c1f8b-dd82-4ecf-b4cd-58532910e72d [Thermothielavioides terrestris]